MGSQARSRGGARDKGDVLVAGAGPAGLMAAIFAARGGARVTVCEQLDRLGAKLRVTGGGRCNLTNLASLPEFSARFGRQGRFMLNALQAMDSAALRRFFEERGVPTASPDGFHVFPVSENAADVLGALLDDCRKLNVRLRTGCRVERLLMAARRVRGAQTNWGEIEAKSVLIACGGRSYPSLGSTGGGYALAEQAGHTIVPPVPALVGLITREKWPAACAGAVFRAARLSIDLPRKRAEATEGEVLFTHAGISGPAALDLSGAVAQLLLKTDTVPLRLNPLPSLSASDWMDRFKGWHREEGKKLVHNLLGRHMPRCLAETLCKLSGDLGGLEANQFSLAGREALARHLTEIALEAVGTEGFEKAMVTRGGVSLKQVDPRTMESRLAKGLYFAGEALDLDGPCGGYNLQWAFSSGALAGSSCHAGR